MRLVLVVVMLVGLPSCVGREPAATAADGGVIEEDGAEGSGAIEVSPPSCDFGSVPFGGVRQCELTIANSAGGALTIDSVRFVPIGDDDSVLFDIPAESARLAGAECNDGATPCAFAFTGQPPSPDEPIEGNGAVAMVVRFTPDVAGDYGGAFEIRSSDPDEPTVEVGLLGTAIAPPTCALRIKSVNGAAVEPGSDAPAIEPLDNVVLSVDRSEPVSAGGSLIRQEWRITELPAGSRVELTTEDLQDTSFEFGAGPIVGIDVAGTYCVSAQVFDDVGVGSVNDCSLCFDAISRNNLSVELTWDTSASDVDLHMTKESPTGDFCFDATSGSTDVSDSGNGNASFFSQECDNGLDCNYAGCNTVEWDGAPGRSAGDPVLEMDTLTGFGPERIGVEAMTPGLYVIGVNGFSGSLPAAARVRIFVFGQLASDLFREIGAGTWWEVALVRWPDGIETTRVCVEDLTDGTSGDEIAACDELEAGD